MKNLKKIAILASIYKALHKIEVQNSGFGCYHFKKKKYVIKKAEQNSALIGNCGTTIRSSCFFFFFY